MAGRIRKSIEDQVAEAMGHKWDEFACHYRYMSHRLTTSIVMLKTARKKDTKGRPSADEEVTLLREEVRVLGVLLQDLKYRLDELYAEKPVKKKQDVEENEDE
jgi:hypothetical protein